MRLAATLVLFALIGPATFAQQPAAPAAALTVRGVVTTANDAPLPRVRVAIPAAVPPILAGSNIRRAPERVVLTDDLGRFTIRVAASASTILEFSKARYITQAASISPRDLSTPGSEVRVRMALAGAISGQVIDRSGGPLWSATVTLRRAGDARDSAPLATTTTNDLGEYRFGGLAPGRYVASAKSSVFALGADIPDDNVKGAMISGQRREALVDAAAVTGPAVDVSASSETNGITLMINPPSEIDAGAGNKPDASPDATASVSGRVVGVDGRPIQRAVVHVHLPYVTGRQVETDQNGRYRVDRLVPGDYTIGVRKFGFEQREYGQQVGEVAGRPVTLKIGQSLDSLDVTLVRGGAIAGTIVDEFGEPMQDVMVSAVQLQPNPGGVRGIRASSVVGSRTDDRGQYRLLTLFPGAYFVQAVAEGDLTPGSGYLPRLYPGTATFEQATQTKVDFNSDVRGIDFAVIATQTHRVAGAAVDTTGKPVRGSVLLAVSERSGAIQTPERSVNIEPDGSFVFTNVGPGEYVVQASAATTRPDPGRPTRTSVQFAMSYVTVSASDPPSVELRMTQGATLMGSVRYEGLPPGPLPLLTLGVLPTDRDRSPLRGYGYQSVDVQPDGSFETTTVFGPTLIQAQPQRSDWYVKSVLFRGQDLVDTPFDFAGSGTYRDIEVVISTAGATVTGRVTDDRAAPVRDYAVLVFPTFRDRWFAGSRWVKGLRAASLSGPFVVTGLPPGDYWVAAIDPLGSAGPMRGMSGTRALPLADPDLLESLSSRATRVTLGEGQSQDVALRLIRR